MLVRLFHIALVVCCWLPMSICGALGHFLAGEAPRIDANGTVVYEVPAPNLEGYPCAGPIAYCGSCYPTLEAAISAIPCEAEALSPAAPAEVFLATLDAVAVSAPIIVKHPLKVANWPSLIGRPRVTAAFNGSAVFEIAMAVEGDEGTEGDEDERVPPIGSLHLEGFNMEGLLGTFSSAVRVNGSGPVNFTAAGMLFRNFHTLDGVSGSAVYLNQTDLVHIDNETIFVNNTAGVEDARCPHTDGEKSEYCADGCTPVFGGGALYIEEVRGNTTIGGIFANNRVYFNHGQGGAVHIRNVTGTAVVSINASFANNTASEAGAVEIWEVQAGAAVSINGTFLNNSAVDPQGPCGDRGGAIAIRWVRSPVRINGTFIANHSPKFGGVFRSDIMFKGGEVWLSGYFEDNTAKMGSVANIFNLREGSRFVFKPDKASAKRLKGDDRAVFMSRSKECKNDATPPQYDIKGCS